MKFEFTARELYYLEQLVERIIVAGAKRPDMRKQLQVAGTMRNKFRYNAFHSFLTAKQRALLWTFIDYHLDMANSNGGILGEEYLTIRALHSKLDTRLTEEQSA